jgi:putative hydrolase of the HAD superfamily
VAREHARTGGVRMATLNNESAELNAHRIDAFGLHDIFPTFFSSCWLGVRKPTLAIYERVLGMTQTDPTRTLFVDDRLQNLTPAAGLGMRTIHFRSAGMLREELKKFSAL